MSLLGSSEGGDAYVPSIVFARRTALCSRQAQDAAGVVEPTHESDDGSNGNLAETLARLDGCGADPELIVLTKACLSPEAVDRPKDAQAVAEGLTAYLDGVQQRLLQAELAEAEVRAKVVEEAKRRRLTLALAGTVLLTLSLGGGGWLYLKNERNARLETLHDNHNLTSYSTRRPLVLFSKAIVNMYVCEPTTHRRGFVAQERQRIVEVAGEADSLSFHSLPFLLSSRG